MTTFVMYNRFFTMKFISQFGIVPFDFDVMYWHPA